MDTDAPMTKVEAAARLDELRDLVVLLASPEFSKEMRKEYIARRTEELCAVIRRQ